MDNDEIVHRAISFFLTMLILRALRGRITRTKTDWMGFITFNIFFSGLYMLTLQWIANNIM